MASQSSSPSRALVLGGGGAVGVGWQVGILTGLRESGIDFAAADEILGTSAGALVGALLSSGRDITGALAGLGALARTIDSDAMAAGNDAFLDAMRQASLGADPQTLVREIGQTALTANTMPLDVYLGLFGDVLDDIAWPAGFRCTAIDAESGQIVVWDEESGVPLRDAVASSCVVPALFPPVPINGRLYMDGGIISHVNATSISPADVVVVLSCHALGSPDAADQEALVTSNIAADAEIATLRESSTVIAIDPDFGDLNVTQEQMMDANVASQAVKIGRQQAGTEAASILAVWRD
ncbi:patatin-like phospholipase family protein [soil metagenome]